MIKSACTLKFILLFGFSFLSHLGFAQGKGRDGSVYLQYGYVNEVRLDSVQVLYGQLEISSVFDKAASFTYGQKSNMFVRNVIRDKEGNIIFFDSVAAMLNLLDYNGWEPAYTLNSGKDNDVVVIMKKKAKNRKE